MKYTFDLLENPDVFLKNLSTKRASLLPMVNEAQLVSVARLQYKVALLEKEAGAWGAIKNWLSNAAAAGIAFIKGLKDLFIDGVTWLFKKFLGGREMQNLVAKFLQTWIAGEVGPIAFDSFLKGANEGISKGKVFDIGIETPELNTRSALKEGVDYDAYYMGYNWSARQQENEALPTSPISDIPGEVDLQSYIIQKVRDELPARAVVKVVEEFVALINPIGVWNIMQDSYKKILGTNDQEGNWGLLKASLGAILIGSTYGLVKYIIITMSGATFTGAGMGALAVFIFKSYIFKLGGASFAKSAAAKLLAKGFSKLWKKYVGQTTNAFGEKIENQINPKDTFIKDLKGKLKSVDKAEKESVEKPELYDSGFLDLSMNHRMASRVAARYMTQSH